MQIQKHKSILERCYLPISMNMFTVQQNMATPAAWMYSNISGKDIVN